MKYICIVKWKKIESRNKSVTTQSTALQQGYQVHTTRKENPPMDGLGKTVNPVSKNEIGPLS